MAAVHPNNCAVDEAGDPRRAAVPNARRVQDLRHYLHLQPGGTGDCGQWIVLALAHAMAPWLAALLVGVVTLGVGGLLFTSAKKKGIKKPFERTQRTLKEDVRWAKERLA